MDTAQQNYTQAQAQSQGKGGSIANVPLPNLSGQANGAVGESTRERTQLEGGENL